MRKESLALHRYSAELSFHRIVERGARNISQLAEAFGDVLNNPYLQFTFRTDTQPFKTRATVMPVIENVNGENHILRKVYYNNVKDFLNTDLFEGYIHGHYLWRCDICDRYFFMTTAHRQLYCSTKNPKYGVPCSYVAKHPEVVKRKMERQKRTDSPYYLLWQKRNDSIRKIKASVNTMRPYLPRQRNILMTVSTKRKSIAITRKRNLRRIWKWRIFTKRQRKC